MANWPEWAVPGRRVVCVDDTPVRGGFAPGHEPRKGNVYTIRGTGLVQSTKEPGVFLEEIGLRDGAVLHTPYRLYRFKPVVEDKSDNEIEAKLYHKKGLHHKAPARKVVSA